MSIPFLLWLGYHLVALPMACWACLGALCEDPGQGRLHRAMTVVGAALVPVAIAITALGLPGETLAGILLPVVTAAIVWSNLVSLVARGRIAHLVHVPILFWNASLVVVYAARAVGACGSDAGGAFGAALEGGHVGLQTWVGHPDAAVAPLWLHVPLCIAAGPRPGWMHRVGLATSGLVASALGLLLVSQMPDAIDAAKLFRSPPGALGTKRADLVLGGPAPASDERTRALSSLGFGAATFDVDLELLQDATRSSALAERIGAARAIGLQILVVARPATELDRHPVGNVAELADAMAKVHWLAAERLAPDVLVLYDGPFGALRSACARIGTIDEWVDACRRGAADVKLANPHVAVGLALESRAPHARELFARLVADDSPVSVVGLSGRADRATPGEALHIFSVYEGWLDGQVTTRRVWLLDVGATPAVCGGEVGQWSFLVRALGFANTTPSVAGVCVRAIDDTRCDRTGLWTMTGRSRIAGREISAFAATAAARPGR